MTRRVMVLKDTSSPLYFIRCAEPCERTKPDQNWCSDGSGDVGFYGRPAPGYEAGCCWLFSSPQRDVCEAYARTCGWEVEA